MKQTVEKNILEIDNKVWMRIQLVLEDYAYRQKLYKKIKLYGPFLWTDLKCIQVLCHYWAANYFHSCLNQMPKRLTHSFYILSIEKNWQYWFNYSDDLLVKLHEKSDTLSKKPFFKHWLFKASLHIFLLFMFVW